MECALTVSGRLSLPSEQMTTLHFSLRTGARGCGAAHARYILRLCASSSFKSHLMWSETGNLPYWARSAVHFFGAADYHERANGIAYREVVIALERQLRPDQQIALAQQYIGLYAAGGKAYIAAIHVPVASDGLPQPHLHLMFSERLPDGIDREPNQFFMRFNPHEPERGGCKKDSAGRHPSEMAGHARMLRAACADLQNQFAASNGISARVDSRSNIERGVRGGPAFHRGPIYTLHQAT